MSTRHAGPSIKSVMNGGPVSGEKITTREQHELYTKQDQNEPYTAEQLQEKWMAYLSTLEDRPNLKTTLSRTPEIQPDGMLLLTIENHIQDELVKGIKPQLVSWLRRELKNSSIDLALRVAESDTRKFAYTDGEKFEEMLSKNPDLALLKQRFNLDFEG